MTVSKEVHQAAFGIVEDILRIAPRIQDLHGVIVKEKGADSHEALVAAAARSGINESYLLLREFLITEA